MAQHGQCWSFIHESSANVGEAAGRCVLHGNRRFFDKSRDVDSPVRPAFAVGDCNFGDAPGDLLLQGKRTECKTQSDDQNISEFNL